MIVIIMIFLRTLYKILMLAAVLVFPAALLEAQHVPGTTWKIRETAEFLILYPETLSEEAAALSTVLDEVRNDTRTGLPVRHKKKKWPLVLTDLGVRSNGFVSLAPRRSVWEAVPTDTFTSLSDWWMLLARHETRHMAQFDASDQGATRALRVLFGETGWGLGLIMGTPRWLLEGDAVMMETLLSEEGRGRDPLFKEEFIAMASEGERPTSYHRAMNPSYKRMRPNFYKTGYIMTYWIRKKYGKESLAEIYKTAARIPLPVIGITEGIKRSTGKLPREIYQEASKEIRLWAQETARKESWTQSEVVSPNPKTYTWYDSLFAAKKTVFARRETMRKAAALIRLEEDGSERELIRLPSRGRGRVSMAELSGSGKSLLRIAWESFHADSTYARAGSTDITVVDINGNGTILRRYQPAVKQRYRYPALSPDGSRLAVVEVPRGESAALAIIDAKNGTLMERVSLPSGNAGHPSWSPKNDALIFTFWNADGRRLAEWLPDSGSIRFLTRPTVLTVKNPVYSADGTSVFFSSNASGLEAVWFINTDSQNEPIEKASPVVNRWYGAQSPAASPDGQNLYFVEYSSSLLGERIAKTSHLSEKEPVVNINSFDSDFLQNATNKDSIERDKKYRNTADRSEIVDEGNRLHPERNYNPANHALNIHSWGIYPNQDLTSLLLGVISDDILGTMRNITAINYQIADSSPGLFTQFFFTGRRPILSLRAEYKYRSPRKNPFHDLSFSFGLNFPINLSRNGIWYNRMNLTTSTSLSLQTASTQSRETTLSPILSLGYGWTRTRPGSIRAFRPEWGWRLQTRYRQILLFGPIKNTASAALKLYTPGIFPNNSLSLGAAIQGSTENFPSFTGTARGYRQDGSGFNVSGSVDYEFPLFYPDLPIGAVVFIQRFRMGLYSDFAWKGGSSTLISLKSLSPRWSTGITLSADFAAFNNFPELSVGVRLNYLWQYRRFSLNFMFFDIALF